MVGKGSSGHPILQECHEGCLADPLLLFNPMLGSRKLDCLLVTLVSWYSWSVPDNVSNTVHTIWSWISEVGLVCRTKDLLCGVDRMFSEMLFSVFWVF